jgi:phosphinothricin acetyltransferase
MTIELLKADALTEIVQTQVEALYRQLNAENKQRPLSEVLQHDNNVHVIICKIDDTIVGIALLTTYKVISGYRGMVDDVVVDESQRGKGIGRKLMERLLEEGKNLGLDEILLFTGHHRTPAIKLYTSLGFDLRKSGLYSLKV